MSSNTSWTHPAHGPIRSRGVPAIRGSILTDSQIDAYTRQGRYGSEAQARILASDAASKPTAKGPSISKRALKHALRLLGL